MELKPIHKFNNGNGATLCNCCRVIISTGKPTDEVLCEQCEPFVKAYANQRVIEELNDIASNEYDDVHLALLKSIEELELKQK